MDNPVRTELEFETLHTVEWMGMHANIEHKSFLSAVQLLVHAHLRQVMHESLGVLHTCAT